MNPINGISSIKENDIVNMGRDYGWQTCKKTVNGMKVVIAGAFDHDYNYYYDKYHKAHDYHNCDYHCHVDG